TTLCCALWVVISGTATVLAVDVCAFVFFSSRRRHTRSLCDWSSDVCSSDLKDDKVVEDLSSYVLSADGKKVLRSEERRGGEKGRNWGGACPYIKKKKQK